MIYTEDFIIIGTNKLSRNGNTAVNTYGDEFSVGDEVNNEGNGEIAKIEYFEIDEEAGEVTVKTTLGRAHIDHCFKRGDITYEQEN